MLYTNTMVINKRSSAITEILHKTLYIIIFDSAYGSDTVFVFGPA